MTKESTEQQSQLVEYSSQKIFLMPLNILIGADGDLFKIFTGLFEFYLFISLIDKCVCMLAFSMDVLVNIFWNEKFRFY